MVTKKKAIYCCTCWDGLKIIMMIEKGLIKANAGTSYFPTSYLPFSFDRRKKT